MVDNKDMFVLTVILGEYRNLRQELVNAMINNVSYVRGRVNLKSI